MRSLYDQLSVDGKYTLGIDGASANVLPTDMLPEDSSMRWDAARLQGVEYMMWRMGVGSWMDPSFVPNMLGAAQAGITNRAGYLVLWPTTSTTGHMDTIRGQLAGLADVEGPEVQPPTIMLDVERKASSRIKQALRQFFKPALVNSRLIQVADRIKAMQDGLEPIFYSNKDYVDSFMGSRAQKSYLVRFKGRVFIANYRYEFLKSIKNEKPAMPWPLKDEDAPMNGALWHQFTADENRLGYLFGYDHSSAIDISRTLLKGEDLALAFGHTIAIDPPPPDPETEPELPPIELSQRVDALENRQREISAKIKAIELKTNDII